MRARVHIHVHTLTPTHARARTQGPPGGNATRGNGRETPLTSRAIATAAAIEAAEEGVEEVWIRGTEPQLRLNEPTRLEFPSKHASKQAYLSSN